MLDEEILLKYKADIDDNIEILIKEYGLTTESEIEALTSKYEQNFIKGFKEGIEIGEARGEARGEAKRNVEIAKEMLADGDSVEKVGRITGLPLAQIKELQVR